MIVFLMRMMSIAFWSLMIICFLILPSKVMSNFGKKTLNIFTWSNILDARYLRKFQEDTGIKINLSYFESNEELLGKIGDSDNGYDLIVPSDYAVDWMIKKNMLKKIDKSRLDFFDRLDKRLIHNYFDPHNDYSIPYYWGSYGIVLNKTIYQKDLPHSLKLIFDPDYAFHKVCMPSNSREVVMLAAFYLFGEINALLDAKKREQVKDLLIQQKKWIASYSDERVAYALVSHSCSAVLSLSSEYWLIPQEERDDMEFIIPQEGSMVVIDNFVISKNTQKDDLIYTFLNYIYSDDSITHHGQLFGFCPPLTLKNSTCTSETCKVVNSIKKFTFFDSNAIPQEIFNDIWMELMAA